MTFRKLWKRFWEPLLERGPMQWFVAFFMMVAIWLVYFTSRKEIIGRETLEKYKKQSAVFVFWHGRTMMLSPVVITAGIKGYAITSKHQGGRLMAKLLYMFGLKNILGSTSDGGISVLKKGIRIMREGNSVICISPDGPGGPSLRVQDGALYFAKMSGAPIISVCFTSSRAKMQNRWDRFMIAFPFSKILCKVADPVFISKKISKEGFEKKRKEIEDMMVKQLHEMDAIYGYPKVEQDLESWVFKKQREEKARERKRKREKKEEKII